MSFSISYQLLCSVNVWHGYYLHPVDLMGNVMRPSALAAITSNPHIINKYTILNDLGFRPSGNSSLVMKNYRIVFRQVPAGFNLYIQVIRDGRSYIPFISLSGASETLTFFIFVKNPAFYNFTNLDQGILKRNIFLFSNTVNNSDETGTLYLNHITPPHQYITPDYGHLRERTPDMVLGDIFLKEKNIIGSVDISLNSTDLVEYALVNPEQALQEPVYTLWWQNRMTRWRYVFNHPQCNHPRDPQPIDVGNMSFEDDNKNKLVTNNPIPLLHNNRSLSVILESEEDGTQRVEVPLPDPENSPVYPEGTNAYSEIYMGNTNLI